MNTSPRVCGNSSFHASFHRRLDATTQAAQDESRGLLVADVVGVMKGAPAGRPRLGCCGRCRAPHG